MCRVVSSLLLCRVDLCRVDFLVNESTRHTCRVDRVSSWLLCRVDLCRVDLCRVDFLVNESTRHTCRVDRVSSWLQPLQSVIDNFRLRTSIILWSDRRRRSDPISSRPSYNQIIDLNLICKPYLFSACFIRHFLNLLFWRHAGPHQRTRNQIHGHL